MKKLLFILAFLLSVNMFSQTTIPDYPQNSSPADADMLLGTDAATLRTNNFKLNVLKAYFTDGVTDLLNTAVKVVNVPSGTGSISSRINALTKFEVGTEELCVFNVVNTPDTVSYLLIPGKGTYGSGGTAITDDDVYLVGGKVDLTNYARTDAANTFTELQHFNTTLYLSGNVNGDNTTYTGVNKLVFGGEGEKLYFNYNEQSTRVSWSASKGLYDDLRGSYLMQGTVIAGNNVSIANTVNGITISATGDLNTRDDSITLSQAYSNLGVAITDNQSDINEWLNTAEPNIARLNESNIFISPNRFNGPVSAFGGINLNNSGTYKNIDGAGRIEIFDELRFWGDLAHDPFELKYDVATNTLYNGLANGSLLQQYTVNAGTGISITRSNGGITITNTGTSGAGDEGSLAITHDYTNLGISSGANQADINAKLNLDYPNFARTDANESFAQNLSVGNDLSVGGNITNATLTGTSSISFVAGSGNMLLFSNGSNSYALSYDGTDNVMSSPDGDILCQNNVSAGDNIVLTPTTKGIEIAANVYRHSNRAYLDVINQNLSTTSDVTFNKVSTGDIVATGTLTANGVSSLGDNLTVDGNIDATGEITAYSTSDKRLKTNVKTMKSALSVIEKLRPVMFEWNKKAVDLNSAKKLHVKHAGVIAQEAEKVVPEIVGTIYHKYKGVDYEALVPYLIGAIQELSVKVDSLEGVINKNK